MKKSTLLGVLMFSCFIFCYGTCGAYENDAITEMQVFIRLTLGTVLFFMLDYIRVKLIKREFAKKKALRSCNYNKAHCNKNYNKSLPCKEE